MRTPPVAISPDPTRETPTLEEILERVGDVERGIFSLVRSRLDALELAAPWDLLYFLPDSPDKLLSVLGALKETVEAIPLEVSNLVKALRSLPEADEEILEETSFFFSGVHEMVSHDLDRLTENLAPFEEGEQVPSMREQSDLCEIGADLKGKYASAMMGVAASILGRELEEGLAIEAILFPEKAEEFSRNELLLAELAAVVEAMRRLASEVPFEEMLERWRHHLRVEQYALADLSILRGRLRRLLQQRHRRALYSGDYQRIKRREEEFSYRLVAMEELHLQTWKGPSGKEDLEGMFSQLVQIVLELAAILDTNILKRILGEQAVASLRQTTDEEVEIARGHLPDTARRQAVAAFLAEEDLRTFLDFLYGVVRKRSSLLEEQEAMPQEESRGDAFFDLDTLADSSPVPVVLPDPEESKAGEETSEKFGPPPLRARDALSAESPHQLAVLDRLIGDICSPENPRWNSFRMVHRLVEKHSRVPPSMIQGAAPLLEELKSRLAPQLEDLGGKVDLGQTVVHQIRAALLALRGSRIEAAQSPEESGASLKRIAETISILQQLAEASRPS